MLLFQARICSVNGGGNKLSRFLHEIVVSLVIISLCYSLVPFAFASSSVTLGITYGQTDEEKAADNWVMGQITYYSNLSGYSTYNWYGANTTTSNIYTAASGNVNYDYPIPHSIAFYMGEGGVNDLLPPFCPQWYIENNDGGLVYDLNIYNYSPTMQVRLAVIWACHSGDVIGGTNYYDYLPPLTLQYGMPNAWLHTTSLSNDGYANPDSGRVCFIGFHEAAPKMTNNPPLLASIGDWIRDFYEDALQFNETVNQALDDASITIWRCGFQNCILRQGYLSVDGVKSWMVVYGDGNINLKPANPLVAEKTGTDGHFNLPDPVFVPWSALEIKMLFDQTNLTGDQTGGGSPYSEIAHYPSGSVMGDDIAFIGRQFGTYEGETTPTKWDYMADIVPPWGRVDGKDVATAARNFGAFGGNITDLSGVSVAYYVGWTHECDLTPNADGFVNIPPDATSFNVTRNRIPIGATVVFWGP